MAGLFGGKTIEYLLLAQKLTLLIIPGRKVVGIMGSITDERPTVAKEFFSAGVVQSIMSALKLHLASKLVLTQGFLALRFC